MYECTMCHAAHVMSMCWVHAPHGEGGCAAQAGHMLHACMKCAVHCLTACVLSTHHHHVSVAVADVVGGRHEGVVGCGARGGDGVVGAHEALRACACMCERVYVYV